MASDELTLTVNGLVYSGWTSIRVTMAIDRAAGDFDISVSERWGAASTPWQIQPFDACVVAIDGTPILTGYVDTYMPSYDSTSHKVRVTGRSKTMDLIDCVPVIPGSTYDGYRLDAIAKGVCGIFGIGVVVEAPMGDAFTTPDATLDKCETGFAFLERLCRLRSVLACDDASGNLVLTQAGAASAQGALVEGQNIWKATGTLSGAKRFSQYSVYSQTPALDGVDATDDVIGVAEDPTCPRYRPFGSMAESSLTADLAQQRAIWEAAQAVAKGIQATITVQGWRQTPGGALWTKNQLVSVTSPRLKLQRSLLIAGVEYRLDENGRVTVLTLGPQEAYTPDPASVKGVGASSNWNDAKSIAGASNPE